MATEIQQLRGTTAENDEFIGKQGVITVDTTRKSIRVHDGVTPGGREISGLDTPPIVVFASGQSNMARHETMSWTPPENLFVWNHHPQNDGPTHVGTAFEPADPNKVNVATSFAAEVARAYPASRVYVINTAASARPISNWLPGGSPDMFAAGVNNMEAALAVVGPRRKIIHLWWQGETDAFNQNANYESDFLAYRARYLSVDWWTPDMQFFVFGVSPYMTGTDGDRLRRFNKVLSRCAAVDPEKARYIHSGGYGTSYWQTDRLHMTAEGYDAVGKLAHNVMAGGLGRPTLESVIVDPFTKQLIQPLAYAFYAIKAGASSGDVTGYNAPVVNTMGDAFNPTTGIFTVPLSGLWTIDNMLLVSSAGSATQQMHLNGANFGNGSAAILNAAGSTQMSLTHPFQEGDQLKIFVSAGAPDASRFGARFVG